MPMIVVEERFDPPVDMSKPPPHTEKLSPCLPDRGITWVASYVGADGSRCVCIYDAPDAESVRQAYRIAGVPFTAAWPAVNMHA